jgi:hypothetical protein
MFPLNPLAYWQECAQATVASETVFASNRGTGDADGASAFLQNSAEGGRDCYPFPSDWPGPQKVGPFFSRPGKRRLADLWRGCGIRFSTGREPVDSGLRTTNNRGGPTCVKPFLSFPLLPCPWPVACKTLRRVGLLVRQLAQVWPMPLAAMRLQAPLSAALVVLRPVGSMWGCRPAIDLTPAPVGRGLSFMTASRV